MHFLWTSAGEHGVADRLLAVVGSVFGPTNSYDADNGRIHWPIGSFLIMEKNQPWANRSVGERDGLHFARRVNPRTREPDNANVTIIYPQDV